MNPIIKLSDNAAERIKEIMSNAEKDSLGVRVSVKSGGCAGMSYVMEYTKEVNPNDEVIEEKGVKVFVDSAAIMYLFGTEMDYKKQELLFFVIHFCSKQIHNSCRIDKYFYTLFLNNFIIWIYFFGILHDVRHTSTTSRFN